MDDRPLDRLSWGARGLLLDGLQRLDPAQDDLDPKALTTPRNGRDAVGKLLTELESGGFLRRWRTAGGRDDQGRLRGGTRSHWSLHLDGDAGDSPER